MNKENTYTIDKLGQGRGFTKVIKETQKPPEPEYSVVEKIMQMSVEDTHGYYQLNDEGREVLNSEGKQLSRELWGDIQKAAEKYDGRKNEKLTQAFGDTFDYLEQASQNQGKEQLLRSLMHGTGLRLMHEERKQVEKELVEENSPWLELFEPTDNNPNSTSPNFNQALYPDTNTKLARHYSITSIDKQRRRIRRDYAHLEDGHREEFIEAYEKVLVDLLKDGLQSATPEDIENIQKSRNKMDSLLSYSLDRIGLEPESEHMEIETVSTSPEVEDINTQTAAEAAKKIESVSRTEDSEMIVVPGVVVEKTRRDAVVRKVSFREKFSRRLDNWKEDVKEKYYKTKYKIQEFFRLHPGAKKISVGGVVILISAGVGYILARGYVENSASNGSDALSKLDPNNRYSEHNPEPPDFVQLYKDQKKHQGESFPVKPKEIAKNASFIKETPRKKELAVDIPSTGTESHSTSPIQVHPLPFKDYTFDNEEVNEIVNGPVKPCEVPTNPHQNIDNSDISDKLAVPTIEEEKTLLRQDVRENKKIAEEDENVIKVVVEDGDTVSDILAKYGDPYGMLLTKFIIRNADLLMDKNEKVKTAVEIILAHPNWTARGNNQKNWAYFRDAACLINIDDELEVPTEGLSKK